jgi:iron complex transport system ATP-binding protein
MKPVLQLESVSFHRNGTAILRNVSWTVSQGENWVLFGPNGAGKTTLLNILTGYLWPSVGGVSVLGERLGEVDVAELRRHIAVVSEPLGKMMNPGLKGLEVLVTGAREHLNLFAPPSAEELRQAEHIAAATHAGSLLHREFGVMSTGERQRVLIARALMASPSLVILDEPCAGLDIAGREFVLRTIDAVASHDNPPATVLTTHHVEEISSAFGHALLIREGECFSAGPIARTLTTRNLTRVFGIPVRVTHRHGRWTAAADHRAP